MSMSETRMSDVHADNEIPRPSRMSGLLPRAETPIVPKNSIGSFTHAGEQLGLSQSAVSRQVSALEQELAVSLFHRHARGLILTEQGELLYRTAHDVFMKLEAARAKNESVGGQAQ